MKKYGKRRERERDGKKEKTSEPHSVTNAGEIEEMLMGAYKRIKLDFPTVYRQQWTDDYIWTPRAL